MRNITKQDLQEASQNASTYQEFKLNLKALGNKVPDDVHKFPMNMKGWKRKLRYEQSKDFNFGTPVTDHDLRQKRYYERLEKLGHPQPEKIMQ